MRIVKLHLHISHKKISGVVFLTTLIFMLIITGLIISFLQQLSIRQKADDGSYQITNQQHVKTSKLLNTMLAPDLLLKKKSNNQSISFLGNYPVNGYSYQYFASTIVKLDNAEAYEQSNKANSTLMFNCIIPKKLTPTPIGNSKSYTVNSTTTKNIINNVFTLTRHEINEDKEKITIVERTSSNLLQEILSSQKIKNYSYALDNDIADSLTLINIKHDFFIIETNENTFSQITRFAELEKTDGNNNDFVLILIKDGGYETKANVRIIELDIKDTHQPLSLPNDNNQLLLINTGIDIESINTDSINAITINNQQFIHFKRVNNNDTIIEIVYTDETMYIKQQSLLASNNENSTLAIKNKNQSIIDPFALFLDRIFINRDKNKRCQFIAAK